MKVHAKELSTIKMVEGNEKLYRVVVDGDVVKEWVGIGWIELRKATDEDRAKHPVVERM
jgi:hypothetical protein